MVPPAESKIGTKRRRCAEASLNASLVQPHLILMILHRFGVVYGTENKTFLNLELGQNGEQN